MNFQDMCGCNGACNPADNENPDYPYTCDDKPFPFSSEELEIFDHLLSIRKEVDELKKQLAELENRTGDKSNGDAAKAAHDLEEKINCETRISALRHEWNEWKRKSEEAAIRRMIALGHIEPDSL